MIVRYAARAAADLAEIGVYLFERSPAGARSVRAAIEQTITAVAIFPRIGRAQTARGVRKATIRGYPYAIYYRYDEADAAIDILTIRHASRRPMHR